MDNSSTVLVESQEVLHDCSESGRERPWRVKKMANELLSLAYDAVDPKKAERLRGCADFLRYRVEGNGRKTLEQANFCRVRLCPVCAWRRSLKCYNQCRQVMDAMRQDGIECAYIFVSLTVRNVTGAELGETLDQMMKGFNKMSKYVDFSKAVKGYYRGAEVTHNLEENTFHPHFHLLLAVRPSYFRSRYYISQRHWAELWARAIDADYLPIVDVRKCRGSTAAAVAEVSKYSVKEADYIVPDDWDLTIETVQLLDKVLNNRRFVSFGGVMGEYHRKLEQDDAEDGDLLHVEADSVSEAPPDAYIDFIWHTGYRQYLSN